MTRKFNAAAIAAAIAILPFAALAQADKAGGSASPPSTGTTQSAPASGGAEAMFKSLDKNGDGFISKDEARGSPHDKDFAKLDKDGDGKLSRAEHAAAPEHGGMAPTTGKAPN
jgi:hypothetical protein